jgi:predicted amidohydrolase
LSRAIKLGVAQITGAPYAPAANLERTLEVGRDLFAQGADLIVLPELIVPGYALAGDRLREVAEPVDGPAVSAWIDLARESGGYIAAGLAERVGDDLFNTALVVGPEGVLLHYRKLHVFQAEKSVFTPGDLGLPIVTLPFGVVGLCVCYDLRFVETVRVLTLKGAELICVPTAWTPGFDTEHWDAQGYCPQARGAVLQANLDQTFIACASQARTSADGPQFLGSSVVADPYGKVLAGPLPGREEALVVVDIDLDQAVRAHDRDTDISPRNDRRSDVYGLAVDGAVL